MFVKRVKGKRVRNRATSERSVPAEAITTHEYYSGSPAGVERQARVIEVEGVAPRPLKRPRTTIDEPSTEAIPQNNDPEVSVIPDEFFQVSRFHKGGCLSDESCQVFDDPFPAMEDPPMGPLTDAADAVPSTHGFPKDKV